MKIVFGRLAPPPLAKLVLYGSREFLCMSYSKLAKKNARRLGGSEENSACDDVDVPSAELGTHKAISAKALRFLKDPNGRGVDNFDFAYLSESFEKCLVYLNQDLETIKIGRPTPALLENLPIAQNDAGGAVLPLKSIAQIAAKDGYTLQIKLYDGSFSNQVIKALSISEPPFQAYVKDENTLFVPIPKLDESAKAALQKQVGVFGEKCKMKIRSCRRDALSNTQFLSNEEVKRLDREIQKIHDKFIAKIDLALAAKKIAIKHS